MSLVLLNLKSNQQIKLDDQNPFIIGRGNVEGCVDKRVSRSHGRITCTVDGKIRLVALHCNPCFFTRNGVPPVVQLNKDEEEILGEGDCLGLLPNAFWFQITTSKDKNIKEEPVDSNCKSVEINDDHKAIKEEVPDDGFLLGDTEVVGNIKCMPNNSSDSQSSTSVPSLSTETVSKSGETLKLFGSPDFEKTRRLPLWMYEIEEPVKSNKSSNKHKLVNNQETKNKKPRVSDIKKEPGDESEGAQVGDEVAIINTASTASTSKLESHDQSNPGSSPQPESKGTAHFQGESSRPTNHKEGYESDVNDGLENPPKRPICQYEDKCYRKNSQHKLDYCHPGDADYVPYEKRPLCQYGAACYRRNESHRAEFRHSAPGSNPQNISPSSCSHTSLGEERPPCLNGSSCRIQNPKHRKDFYHPPKASSPLPAKRRRKKVKRENSGYEDEDEYDLEDPFVNDASSDEYVPSDWESEEEVEDFEASQEDE